jgi:coenzyme F420-reducing hydrogenase alpha subunit
MLADDAGPFIAAPTWDGGPRETSALQRRADAPLVQQLLASQGKGLLARQVARLDELVATVARMAELVAGVAPESRGGAASDLSGAGVAGVEAARGRLAHAVVLDHGTVVDYRILAPTEWNFHPAGPLARGLVGMAAGDDLQARAQLLVDAIDPCVDARIEIRGSGGDA